jgi:hypothetical protein
MSMFRRYLGLLTGALLSLALLPATASAGSCPNQTSREQNSSTNLPDCRAYEMVSPLDKNGGDVGTLGSVLSGGVAEAAPDGNRMTYASYSSFGEGPKGAAAASQYLANRTSTGWSTENITPPSLAPETPIDGLGFGGHYKAFNTNLTEAIFQNSDSVQELLEEPVGGAPAGYRDYILHNFSTDANRALLTATPPQPPGAFNNDPDIAFNGAGATPDLTHIVLAFANPHSLAEWANGQLEPVNILPNGEPFLEAVRLRLGSGDGRQDRTVSDDGSRIFWNIEDTAGHADALYVREGLGSAQPTTIQYDAGIGGGGEFLTAASDGSRVFFTKKTVANRDLYEYSLESKTLSDLTPTANPSEAQVAGVLGASGDGSYVYFVASGKLTPSASAQNCELLNADTGCNLYLWHSGSPLKFIARLTGADVLDWDEIFAKRTARVSADGRHVVFMSDARLTPYDNTGSHCVPVKNVSDGKINSYSPGKCQEVYEYEVGAALPLCVSCSPNGVAPVGPSMIPGGTPYALGEAVYASRVLADDGARVFFNSRDALVPEATNGDQNVYEWEEQGTGTCEAPPGCVSLISGGTGGGPASFVDASEDGSDVFFATGQRLTPRDTDEALDLYDAREMGGYSIAGLPPCTGTGCQGLPGAPPVFATPPTGTFSGPGNSPPTPSTAHNPVVLTRAQMLVKALRQCSRIARSRRGACKARVHKRFGPRHKARKSDRGRK